MSSSGARGTGNDDLSGVDPGGTHSTKPGNPNKAAPDKAGSGNTSNDAAQKVHDASKAVDGRKNADANDI